MLQNPVKTQLSKNIVLEDPKDLNNLPADESKNTEDLERKMEKLTVDSNSEEQKTPESSIGKALKSFMHASECEEVDCAFPNCVNMKVKVSHIRRCKKRAVNGCKTCQKVMELYFKHAENCELDECSVPFCLNIRKR